VKRRGNDLKIRGQEVVPRISETRSLGYTNGIYGIADYLTLPIGMLLAAPFLLGHLGVAQYGVWLLASAAVSGGGIVSGSFGDAAIKYVGECRSREDWSGIARIVQNMMSINLALSGMLALILWCLTAYLAHHIAKGDPGLKAICIMSLRIGSGLLLVKSIEGVFISTLRGFEIYGVTVQIAMITRSAILASAIVLASYGRNVVWIMCATLALSVIGMVAQGIALRNKIGRFSLIPIWHRKIVSDIATFGTFSWLQAVSSVVFSHADRFFVAFFMGAPAVAYYGLCVQAAQPIHGLVSSGMHFLFPHLSARYPVAPSSEIKRKVVLAVRLNLLIISILSLPVIFFGKYVLRMWIGSSFDQQSPFIFPIIVLSFALLGLNITAHYALLAAGQVRIVTGLNLLAGAATLLLMALSIRGHGLLGAAMSRLIYGPITCLAYIRLHRVVWPRDAPKPLSPPALYEATNQ
jgi:O-antigen/teichoic acid export membrane protein